MIELDRDKLFDNNNDGEYAYCIHCERTYKDGDFRLEDAPTLPISTGYDGPLQLCPYSDCSGDIVFDALSWNAVRGNHTDDSTYPEHPEHGVIYPLN